VAGDVIEMSQEPENKWVARAMLFIVASAVISLGVYLRVTGVSRWWVSSLILTGCLFGVVVHETKDNWKYGRYWLVLLACLIVHVALLITIQNYLAPFPLAVLGALGTLEFCGIFWILLSVCH